MSLLPIDTPDGYTATEFTSLGIVKLVDTDPEGTLEPVTCRWKCLVCTFDPEDEGYEIGSYSSVEACDNTDCMLNSLRLGGNFWLDEPEEEPEPDPPEE